MSQIFFITGTGTGIGKTIVTCSLIRQMKESGRKVMAIKPVISGWAEYSPENDVLQITEALGLHYSQENIDKIAPWRFKASLAASMAARKENSIINYDKIVSFCKDATTCCKDNEMLLIEGAGGIMAPVTDNKTNLDLICDLNVPAILVTGTYLGAISHTLTALRAMESAGAKIHCIIVNESLGGVGLTETILELKNFTRQPIHGLRMVTAHDGFIWQRTDNLLKCIF